jgi:hypothetical protein
MKPTNWKNVVKGTPVLFRDSVTSGYEAGNWLAGYTKTTKSGVCTWYAKVESGKEILGGVVTVRGKWHCDTNWIKLADAETKVAKPVTVKPTSWKNVANGTPVLFRRTEKSEYEEGTWDGSDDIDEAGLRTFYWDVISVSGQLFCQCSGASVTANGEWHIDPFWCKLKTEQVEAKPVTVKPQLKTTKPKTTPVKTITVEVTKEVSVTYESKAALRAALASLKTGKYGEVSAVTGGAGNDYSYRPKNKRIAVKVKD